MNRQAEKEDANRIGIEPNDSQRDIEMKYIQDDLIVKFHIFLLLSSIFLI